MIAAFWAEIVLTCVGGSIAIVSALLAVLVAYKLNRKKEHRTSLNEALGRWARSFEAVTSIHSNYYNLTLQYDPEVEDRHLKELHQREIVRVSSEAGNAGRTLDGDYYLVLLLEKRKWVRAEVIRLTELTRQEELKGARDVAREYLAQVPEMRAELLRLIERLAKESE